MLNLKKALEDVEMNPLESKNVEEIMATFTGLDSNVDYTINVCTLINGCIVSKKCISLKHVIVDEE